MSGALRFDRALTAICGRVFPRAGDAELLAAEEARADEARRRRPKTEVEPPKRKPSRRAAPPRRAVPAPAPPQYAPAPAPAAAPRPLAPSVESAAVVYELRPLDASACPPGCAAPALEKPFMRTPAGLTATALARYVASRLPAATGREVLICASGRPVHGDTPLGAVLQSVPPPQGGSDVPAVRYCFAPAQAGAA
jgi:hypothetical protein